MFTGNVTIFYTAMINNFIQTGKWPYRLIRFAQGWGHCNNIGASKCYRPFISSTLLLHGSRQNERAVTILVVSHIVVYCLPINIIIISMCILYECVHAFFERQKKKSKTNNYIIQHWLEIYKMILRPAWRPKIPRDFSIHSEKFVMYK